VLRAEKMPGTKEQHQPDRRADTRPAMARGGKQCRLAYEGEIAEKAPPPDGGLTPEAAGPARRRAIKRVPVGGRKKGKNARNRASRKMRASPTRSKQNQGKNYKAA